METDSSLNTSIDSAKRHYSSMFFLPSLKQALAGVAALCIAIGGVTYAAASSQGLTAALLLALSLFVVTFAADLLVSKVILRGDPIFTLRRTTVLSLTSIGFWLVFMLLGVGLSLPFTWLTWVQLSL